MLNIGSVFEKNGVKFLVMGYSVAPDENGKKPVYVCSIFPAGFIDENSLIFVSFDADFSVLFNGYDDERYAQQRDAVGKFLEAAAELSDEEIEQFSKDIEEIISEVE